MKAFIGKYNGPDDYDVTGLPTLEINLTTGVPFISLSQCEGRGTITAPTGDEYNLSKKTVPSSNSLDAKATYRVCALSVEDEFINGNPNPLYTGIYDRLVTVSLIESVITHKEMVLVFDKVLGSFFMMPPVYAITDSITTESCGSSTLTMHGYRVGMPQKKKELQSPINDSIGDNYELVSESEISTKTHVMELSIYGSSNGNNDTSGLILDASGNTYLETLKVSVLELVSLGASSSIITDKVNVSKLLNMANGNYHPINMGKVEVSDLLIPLYV